MEFSTAWDDYSKSVIDPEAIAFASNDFGLSFGVNGSALTPSGALWTLSSPWDPSASLSLDPAILSPPFSLPAPSPYSTAFAPPPLSPGLTSTLSTLSPTDLIGSSPESSASGWGSSTKTSISGPSSVGEESSDYHSGSPHHTSGSEETCHEEERVKPKRRRKMTDKRREQNRLAQRNLRARRQALQSEHLGRVEELEQQNGELREALSRLREENIRLRKLQKKE